MSKQTTAFYNNFSVFYPLISTLLRKQKKRLFKELNKLPHGKLLEIGIGNGADLQQYKRHDITGIDTSVAMLKIARRNCPDNIELTEMNGEKLLFEDEVFDYVVLAHVIAVVDDADLLLSEIYRVLKPRGRLLILNHFTPDNWLRYIDKGLRSITRHLHFKSFFRMCDVQTIKQFTLQNEISVSAGSYFKILIYKK